MKFSAIEPLEARIAPATISIASSSILEGNGDKIMLFTVTVTPDNGETSITSPVIVTVSTESGGNDSASADTDYIAKSGQLTFTQNGALTQEFSVTINGDALSENAETFTVKLSDANGATIENDGVATGTILNDDAAITIRPIKIAGQSEATSLMEFQVTLSHALGGDLTVDYASGGGTATKDVDYTDAVGTLTFAKGETSKTINVAIINDLLDELNETFNLTLSGMKIEGETRAFKTGDTSTAVGIIQNDERTLTLDPAGWTGVEGTGGTKNAVFIVTMNQASDHDVIFTYSTVDGTAKATPVGTDPVDPADYTGANNISVTIPKGQTTAQINIPIRGDALIEGNEDFKINLTSVEHALILDAGKTATATINNDDPTFSISDVTITEGSGGSKTAVFFVSLAGDPGGGEVTVDYKTGGGTATVDEDYTDKSGTLTFKTAAQVQTISIPILGDSRRELEELFNVTLSGAMYKAKDAAAFTPLANIVYDTGEGKIVDDDLNPTLSVTDSKISEDGSKMIFTVTLSQASDLEVKFDYATVDGVAKAGDDYTNTFGTFAIAAGQTSKTVEVPIISDSVVEADEAFQLKLSNATIQTGPTTTEGLTITRDLATGTIETDDFKVIVAGGALEVSEGEGTGKITFTLKLDGGVNALEDILISYSTSDLLAKAGLDYTAVGAGKGVATIAKNSPETTIVITVNNDDLYEGGSTTSETFNLQITDVTNATLDTSLANTTNNTMTVVGKIVDDEAKPTISVTGPKIGTAENSVTEGNPGTYTVTLSNPSIEDVTVFYKTEDLAAGDTSAKGSGVNVTDADYTSNTGTKVTIKAGETSATFTVATVGDAVDENDEQFKVLLYDQSSNATIDTVKGSVITTILDDDASPRLTITDAVVNEGGTTMTFTVNASAASARGITVNYSTEDWDAKAGADYVGVTNGSVTIAAGETSKTFTIDITNDTLSEADEKFKVNLSSPVNATIADGQGIGTIRNDEATFKIVPLGTTGTVAGNTLTLTEEGGDGNAQKAYFQVILTGIAPSVNSTVSFKTVPNTATSSGARADFVSTTGTLVFKAGGELVQDFYITLAKDANYEIDEDFTIVLTDSAGAAISAEATENTAKVVIKNNDAAPTVSISDAQLIEGDSGTSKMTFTVKLSAANETADIVVDYQTVDGSAESSGARPDYLNTTGTVTFAKGETEKTFTIDINGDTRDEDDQSFSVQLSANSANPTLGFTNSDSTGTGTIIDNDLPPVISISDLTIGESDSGEPTNVFTIRLNNGNGATAESEKEIIIHYKTIAGTATGGTDFTMVDQIVTIPKFTTQTTISIPILDDAQDELNETFKVQLYDPSNATIGRGTATGTITDDDASAFIAINDVSIIEGDTPGFSKLIFTVSLSSESALPVSVDFATSNAASGDNVATPSGDFYDYIAKAGTVTFAPRDTSMQIEIDIVNDTFLEADQQFEIKLTNAVNGTIADDTGVGTILNGGDTKYGVILKDAYVVEGRGDTNFDGKLNASDTVNKLTFTAVLSAKAMTAIQLKVATQNGTAIAGSDYTARTDLIVVGGGSDHTTFDINVAGDTAWEATETFFVNLVEAPDSVIAIDDDAIGTFKATARGYILNDDINLISNRSLQWIDVDGDLVTLTVNKGALNLLAAITEATAANNYFYSDDDLTLVPTKTAGNQNLGGYVLQLLDFTNDGGAFAGTSVTITAVQQPGFPLALTGDGRVDVGWIASASFLSNEFQVAGWDLGTVTIDGDLAMITAGDSFSTPAISKLDVYSMGVSGVRTLSKIFPNTNDSQGNPTVVPDSRLAPVSNILGPISTLNVKENFQGYLHVIGAQYGSITTLKIGGALQGTDTDGSGKIQVTGRIGTATIGSIIGGKGAGSGLLSSSFEVAGSSLGTIKVLGDIVGGAGDNSGKIAALKVGNVTVGGSVIGGTGDQSGVIGSNGTLGNVTIGGNLVGGNTDGDNASETTTGALVAGTTMGIVKITGSIIGGGAASSGAVISGGSISSVSIGGALLGGAGEGSGNIAANGGSIGTITIGQNADGDSILGGTGLGSGRVFSALNLASLTTAGDVQGGAGNDSGEIWVESILTKLLIKGSLVGGTAPGPLTTNGTAVPVEKSGYITAFILKSATIEDDIVAGQNGGAGIVNAGVIRTDVLESLTVGGSLKGTAAVPVIIAARGGSNNLAMKTILVKGDVAYTEFLAGYDFEATNAGTATNGDPIPYNPRGNAWSADASIGTITVNGNVTATNIVAGGMAGADGRFGSADDRLTSGYVGGDEDNDPVRDASNVISSIASVIIKGNVIPNSDPYGIIAQHIVSVKYGTPAVTLPLTVGAGNDKALSDTDSNPGKPIGAGTNFRAIELLLPV